MDTINKIQECILNNEIENAYNFIIQNEKQYIEDYKFWNLRGMLCFKIQEYEAAISCYKTSININNNYLDGYFNLIYTLNVCGEKLKSAMYSGVAIRDNYKEEFIEDINSLYSDEYLKSVYKEVIEEVRDSKVDYKNFDLVEYIGSKFLDVDSEYIELLSNESICEDWAYIKNNYVITNKEILTIDEFLNSKDSYKLEVLVPYDVNYIDSIRHLASKGLKKCFVILSANKKLKLIEIEESIMENLRNNHHERTITLNKFNAADSNIHALIKYMPEKYKEIYKLNIIYGRDVFELENIVKVPLVSSLTVSGFNTFVNYPKFTYNVDVGHGSLSFKAAGLMDKKNKNFAFTPDEYEKIDKVCITSNMNMLTLSSMAAIPEDKYIITGNPRTDTLLKANGLENLEKLLGKNFSNKKIIFNMPTFHVHENTGLASGDKNLTDVIKIKNFDYDRFDKFLEENNMICIAKVHHAEERTVGNKNQGRELKNLIFISNNDLDKHRLDLYEILNCADILITDYSSIYGDFLFMNKPSIFINTDIDQYRKEKGILLEPYEFWTAGPKVKDQEKLESELLKSLEEENYYGEKRLELRDLFYKYKDDNATLRVWDFIDNTISRENTK